MAKRAFHINSDVNRRVEKTVRERGLEIGSQVLDVASSCRFKHFRHGQYPIQCIRKSDWEFRGYEIDVQLESPLAIHTVDHQ